MTLIQIPGTSPDIQVAITEKLLSAARWAPTADNLQPWTFSCVQDAIDVYYDDSRGAGTTFPAKSAAMAIATGALAENIAKVASAGGLDVAIHFQPDSQQPNWLCRVALSSGKWDDASAEYALSIVKNRHTNRGPFAKKLAGIDKQSYYGLQESGAGIVWIDQKDRKNEVAELVRLASIIRFQNEECHSHLAASLRFNAKEADAGDGLDVATFNLPPGGTHVLRAISSWSRAQALNRMGLYRILASLEAKPIQAAPAVIAIVQEKGEAGSFSAGRLMERIWIAFNGAGVAVQPYYVVADQLQRLETGTQQPEHLASAYALESMTRRTIGLHGDQSLAMLLRIGSPTKSPVRSRRIPLEQLLGQKSQVASPLVIK